MFCGFTLLIFNILLAKACGAYFCSTNSTSCPQHLPFCAAGRCVYQCAQSSYVNRTDCVDNCWDWYINNSRCVERCPALFPFIHEVPLSASTTARYCYAKCPLFTYADGLTCLERCPIDRMFVENDTCVTNCSESLKYRYPVLDRSKRIHVNGTILCIDKCPDGDYFVPGTNELLTYGSRYVLNNTCVKTCGSLYESNGVCVKQCPNDTKTIVSLQVLYNNLSRGSYEGSQFSSSPGKHAVCNGWCQYGPIQNEECVIRCSSGYKEASVSISTDSDLPYARVCVSTCPSDQPYENLGKCVSKCSIFTNGTNCVSDCGKHWFVYNDTCVNLCPQNYSFVTNKRKLHNSDYFYHFINFQSCVESCPSDLLIANNYCVTTCPPAMSIFNQTCVFQCPEPFNLTMIDSVSRCVETCPSIYYITNNTCYKTCPKELKVLNNTCVEECPETFRYTTTNVLAFRCVSECPVNTFYKGDTCVDNCDLVYNDTCVDVCPPVANLMQELVPSYQNGYHKITKCTSKCSDDTFKNGTKCVRHCRNGFVYNNTCVDVCPPSANLTFEVKPYYRYKVTFCLNACMNTTYKEGTRCVVTCNKDLLISNRQCVPICPESQPLTINFTIRYNRAQPRRTECVSICPNNTFVDGDVCVQNCQPHMFVIPPQTCVSHCPKNRSFLNQIERSYPNKAFNVCVELCPDGKLANGSMCIKSYDCKGFQNDGKCLQICPEGFMQVSDQRLHFYNRLQCVVLLPYKIVLSIASFALVLWGTFSCAFISMREGFVNSLLWCRQEKQFQVYTGNFNDCFSHRTASDEPATNTLLDNMEISESEDTIYMHTSEETEIERPIGDDCV